MITYGEPYPGVPYGPPSPPMMYPMGMPMPPMPGGYGPMPPPGLGSPVGFLLPGLFKAIGGLFGGGRRPPPPPPQPGLTALQPGLPPMPELFYRNRPQFCQMFCPPMPGMMPGMPGAGGGRRRRRRRGGGRLGGLSGW